MFPSLFVIIDVFRDDDDDDYYQSRSKSKIEFKDEEDEETFTSTTKTERRTKKTVRSSKKVDLGAAATYSVDTNGNKPVSLINFLSLNLLSKFLCLL